MILKLDNATKVARDGLWACNLKACLKVNLLWNWFGYDNLGNKVWLHNVIKRDRNRE